MDSMLSLVLPFKSNPKLVRVRAVVPSCHRNGRFRIVLHVSFHYGQQRDEYINVEGHIRMGKLLEELDAFAGADILLSCDTALPLACIFSRDHRFDHVCGLV